MNFRKGFTLIEMFIVIMIMGLIIGALGKMFTYKNITRSEYNTCYIHIDSNISSFFQYGLLQKQAYSGDKYEKVKNYQVIFNVKKQKIDLVYSGTDQKKEYLLSGDFVDNINDCHNRTYHTLISGENLKVVINPGLNPDQGKQEGIGMTLYTGDNFGNRGQNGSTGVVYFYYCAGVGIKGCIEKNKIEIDTRTALFKSYFCEKLNMKTKQCISWSE